MSTMNGGTIRLQLVHKCASIFRNLRSPFGYNFVGETIRRVGSYEKASERKQTKEGPTVFTRRAYTLPLATCTCRKRLRLKCRIKKYFLSEKISNENSKDSTKSYGLF